MAGTGFVDRHGRWARCLYELLVFAIKQAWACLFGALMLALLLLTHWLYPVDANLHRYDFLVIAAAAIQVLMLATKLETWEEGKVILCFHIVGTAMEIFKVSANSWSYPEPGVLRILGVPLFSGFMYASVGSYIARVSRLFDFRYSSYPPNPIWTYLLALAIYGNFFSHHILPDIRNVLFAAIVLLYGRVWVHFRIDSKHRHMPLIAGFFLVSLCIWIAENIATFAKAWTYPNQQDHWQLVGYAKLGSWFLLMNISFVLVASIHKPRPVLNP